MTTPETLKPGDVVQIEPIDDLSAFGGCFMLVEQVEPWGAQGFVAIPRKPGLRPERAYFRAPHGQMERIGRAEWAPPMPESAEEKVDASSA